MAHGDSQLQLNFPTVVTQVQAASKFVDLGADSLDTVSFPSFLDQCQFCAWHSIYAALLTVLESMTCAGGDHDGLGREV